MTIEHRDGFADWTSPTGEYEAVEGTPTIDATNGPRGGPCLLFNNNNDAIAKVVSSTTRKFAAIRIKPVSLTGPALLRFDSGTTAQVSITPNTDGSLSARRGAANGTVLGTTSPGLIAVGVQAQIQAEALISDTVGEVRIYLNGSGTAALALTNVDTRNGTPTDINTVRLGGTNSSGQFSFDGYLSDFVVWNSSGSVNNTFPLGDMKVESFFASANGDSSQFTGSDGNSTDNYLLVDAAAPNSTDYVQSSTVGHKDLYGVQNMTSTPTTIFDVAVCGSVLKTDAGSRDIRLLLKSSTTEVEGSTFSLSTSRERKASGFETDPATSAAWTVSGVNGIQIGQKVQA